MGNNKNLNKKKEIEDLYRTDKQKYADLENLLRTRYGEDKTKNDALYRDVLSGYESYFPTGGIDPGAISNIRGDISGLRELGRTGGLNEEAIARYRGGGVYDEFAKTGGYSEGDISNIRSRSNSVIPSMYASLKDELHRQNTAQGGYSPGYTYGLAKSGRDAYRAGAGQALDTEIGIKDKVNSGRQWGATGMTTSENALQTLRTGNMYRGMTGAGAMEQGLEESIRSGRQYGQSGKAGLYAGERENELAMLGYQLKVQGMSDEQLARLLQMYPEGRSVWNKMLKAGLVGAGIAASVYFPAAAPLAFAAAGQV